MKPPAAFDGIKMNSGGAIQSLVEALPDAALVLDERAHVAAANGAAQEALGYIHRGEHIGRTARHPALMSAIATCLRTGGKVVFELSGMAAAERRMDGTAAILSGLSGSAGEKLVLVVLKDISEREALARMRMEFVANASHELRTPLAALSGFIETLQGAGKADTGVRERFLAIMAEQAQRMSRLIDDLLLLSRVEMKVHLTPTATADLNLVASEAIKIAAPIAKGSGTVIEHVFSGEPAAIHGDHDELVQAVQNLISNAIKYGRQGGKVVVAVEPIADYRMGPSMQLSVTDDGPGIAPQHLPRLTERFYRVSTAASREKGGTGLGLAIVKHIALRHRGRIDVLSVPDKGSIFSLVIPRKAAA